MSGKPLKVTSEKETHLAGERPVKSERCTPYQLEALEHIRQRASDQLTDARSKLTSVLAHANLKEKRLEEAIKSLQQHARVVLHFHPDRITNSGYTVARGLLKDGVYQSQFETGISNGSPTAFPGGDRDVWERELFAGAYHAPQVEGTDRPKYGSLEVFRYSDGPSPRFGSCYFVLHPASSARCTFTYGDSHIRPDIVGTIDKMESIMAALLADVDRNGAALGKDGLTVAGVLDYLSSPLFQNDDDAARRPVGRVLDDYIEAQVHGPIELGVDVDKLVVDPSYLDTETGHLLQEMCQRYGIRFECHRGFVLPVESVPDDFRGPTMPSLARRIAETAHTEHLDAASIGVAAASVGSHPERWREWGSFMEVLRRFRQIWHVVVQYGVEYGAQYGTQCGATR